jgi:hypothetical protein
VNVWDGKTKQVPLWGIESFVSDIYDAYDAHGNLLKKMSFDDVKNKIIQKRKDNKIPEPGRTDGAMLECTEQDSGFFNVTAIKDVYLCAPKSTGNMITVVNNCRETVRVAVFGKVKKGNFVCSSADSQEIPAGKNAKMPARQYEKLYLTTELPADDPYTPHEQPVFFGKKPVTKLTFAQVSRDSHYGDGECDDPSNNTYAPLVVPTSKYAVYSLCHPI